MRYTVHRWSGKAESLGWPFHVLDAFPIATSRPKPAFDWTDATRVSGTNGLLRTSYLISSIVRIGAGVSLGQSSDSNSLQWPLTLWLGCRLSNCRVNDWT